MTLSTLYLGISITKKQLEYKETEARYSAIGSKDAI
jgi:hypothetical protein